jgi:predicted outer membrane lipoprotein
MSLILGMDTWVFLAWIGTILATIFCVIYGIYYQFFKKSDKETSLKKEDKNIKNKEDD